MKLVPFHVASLFTSVPVKCATELAYQRFYDFILEERNKGHVIFILMQHVYHIMGKYVNRYLEQQWGARFL